MKGLIRVRRIDGIDEIDWRQDDKARGDKD